MECEIKVKMKNFFYTAISLVSIETECTQKFTLTIKYQNKKSVRRRKRNGPYPQKIFKFKACMLELQGEKHLHFSSELITLGKV